MEGGSLMLTNQRVLYFKDAPEGEIYIEIPRVAIRTNDV
jgi:hypothetical protein